MCFLGAKRLLPKTISVRPYARPYIRYNSFHNQFIRLSAYRSSEHLFPSHFAQSVYLIFMPLEQLALHASQLDHWTKQIFINTGCSRKIDFLYIFPALPT